MAGAGAGVFSTSRRTYLIFYNWILFSGWFQVLYLSVTTLLRSGHRSVYVAVEKPLFLAQTAAVLEVLHSLTGIVRAPLNSTIPQISSRLYVAWGVLHCFPEIHSHPAVAVLVISWALTEIVRYSYFGSREWRGDAPSWLHWLRYSTFLVLYPFGITSEVVLVYKATPFMMASERYTIRVADGWCLSFDYFCVAMFVMGTYVPLSPHLYGYMLKQRRKALPKQKIN